MKAVHAEANSSPVSVTADKEKGTVNASVDINASPERVFRALTTSEMSEWWGQEGMYRTHEYEIDLRPGGKWGCTATGVDGAKQTVGGEYITIDPPKLIEYTWVPSWDNFATSRVRIEIEPKGKGSHVTVIHTGFADRPDMVEPHGEGWTRVLGWLAAYAGRTG